MAGLAPARARRDAAGRRTGPEAAGVPARAIELGDPGVTHDASVPRDQLPAYLGPSEPAAAHTHEWGAALADAPEDAPMEGPALAPYEPTAAE